MAESFIEEVGDTYATTGRSVVGGKPMAEKAPMKSKDYMKGEDYMDPKVKMGGLDRRAMALKNLAKARAARKAKSRVLFK